MRPLRLEMTAFGPFAGTQTLDFRELGANNFFLIHGPTGAGKTSILDGMCFALYGETTGSERKAGQMRSQFASPETRTGVVLDFAIGAEAYRIERSPTQERSSRAESAGTATLATSATLWRRTGLSDDADAGEVLATRARAATEKVERLLGFSVEQFRQVVMLPQGKFRELLSADSGARQPILEQLFNAALYGELERFLKARKNELHESLRALGERLAEVFASLGVHDEQGVEEGLERARAVQQSAEGLAARARAEAEAATAALALGVDAAKALGAADDAVHACDEAMARLGSARVAVAEAGEAFAAEAAREDERSKLAEQLRELETIANKARELESAAAAVSEARSLERAAEAAEAQALRDLSLAEEEALRLVGEVADGGRLRAELAETESAWRDASRLADGLAALARNQQEVSLAGAAADDLRRQADVVRSGLEDAKVGLRQTEELWRAGRSALLAATLVEGEPCPVCGSLAHPLPATAEEQVPGDSVVEEARSLVEKLEGELRTAEARLGEAEKRLAGAVAAREEMKRSLGDASEAGTGPAALEAERLLGLASEQRRALAGLPDRIRKAEQAQAAVLAAREGLERGRLALSDGEQARSRAEGIFSEKQEGVPQELRDPSALAAAIQTAWARSLELREKLERTDQALRSAREALAAAEAEEHSARERADRVCAAAKDVQAPELEKLEAAAREAALARDQAMARQGECNKEAERLADAWARMHELRAETREREESYRSVALLADVANGVNPQNLSFQRYVLSVFLDEVLAAATRRLLEMTNRRFRLQAAVGPGDRRRAAGLDLDVFDEHTGELRPAGTLSGGEGFLASLALALGLAEVVQSLQGGVRLEAVFIDEGFGTLDPEALDAAIDTLLSLREHGRLVGIISHVPELRDRIDCRLEVTPTRNGSAARFVVP